MSTTVISVIPNPKGVIAAVDIKSLQYFLIDIPFCKIKVYNPAKRRKELEAHFDLPTLAKFFQKFRVDIPNSKKESKAYLIVQEPPFLPNQKENFSWIFSRGIEGIKGIAVAYGINLLPDTKPEVWRKSVIPSAEEARKNRRKIEKEARLSEEDVKELKKTWDKQIKQEERLAISELFPEADNLSLSNDSYSALLLAYYGCNLVRIKDAIVNDDL